MKKAAIIGLGLVGGSIAKALKERAPEIELTGVDLPERLALPGQSGLFTSLHEPAKGAAAVRGAEVVFLCTPLATHQELLPLLQRDADPGAVVTDVSGLKRETCRTAREIFEPGRTASFIGGHPLAGKERAGFANADGNLFRGHPWILTPASDAPTEKIALLRELIEGMGAEVILMGPAEHDELIVAVSHLPQLVSVALILAVGGRAGGLAGTGLKAMTRLAGSPGALWDPLLAGARRQVIGELQTLRSYLTEMEMALGLNEPLHKWFDRANELKARMDAARDNQKDEGGRTS